MKPSEPVRRAAALGAILGYTFRDWRLALAAACDCGARGRNDIRTLLRGVPQQSELAWVGDAALHLALTLKLAAAREPLGAWSQRRSHLESNATMGAAARHAGLAVHLLTTGPCVTRCRPLATAFEALVGAAYLDSGHDTAPVLRAVSLLEAVAS